MKEEIILYIVIRSDLNMGVGKVAAQVGHSIQMMMSKYHNLDKRKDSLSEEEEKLYLIFKEWDSNKSESRHKKIALSANKKEWDKVKRDVENIFVVVDAGLTEIPSGSETVISIWPMYKNERPPILKRLRLV